MTFLVTGATGFLGAALLKRLEAAGHQWRALSRAPEGRAGFFEWPDPAAPPPAQALERADAVIHLAAQPVAQRWTAAAKARIRRSRVDSTASLVEAFSRMVKPPQIFISASAIGFYGDRGEEPLNERSGPGSGFLAETCVAWEGTAARAAALGIRVVLPRIGVALGPGGGALAKMLTPFKLGLGGVLGSGSQWMSWIHRDDLTGMLLWAAENPDVRGPLNCVSPEPVRNAGFTRALGAAVHRPAILPVPALSLKLLYGEMSQVLLASSRVIPEAARRHGFQWRFEALEAALAAAVID